MDNSCGEKKASKGGRKKGRKQKGRKLSEMQCMKGADKMASANSGRRKKNQLISSFAIQRRRNKTTPPARCTAAGRTTEIMASMAIIGSQHGVSMGWHRRK
jgi:hypothetical protein